MTSTDTPDGNPLETEELMEGVRSRIRRRYAQALLSDRARGFEMLLRRAEEQAADRGLLLPAALGPEEEWDLGTELQLSSHRRGVGHLFVLVKRYLLLPPLRWLHDFSAENFRRQRDLNYKLMACIEILAGDVAELEATVARLRERLGKSAAADPGSDVADST